MADKVSDFLWERLKEWGVKRVFGYAGDGINAIMHSLAKREDDFEFVQVRHEEMAAFMACGHAKFTGEIGVCLATSGPGAIHLLNGLYDAKLDHQPVLAIVGQQPRTAMGGNYQQEVDLQTLFKDVAHEYVQTVTAAEQLPAVIDRAIRIALSEQTPTCLIFPTDVQELPAIKQTPHEFKMFTGTPGYRRPRHAPDEESLRHAADILNSGKKVAMLIGQGARNAADEVLAVADKLGAGIAKALLGKDVLPDDLPHVTGAIGLLGTKPSYDMMMNCDTLLMIGSSFPYSQFLPEFEQAKGVQIDIDAKMIGIRYPMNVHLIGDSKETLQLLLPMLKEKPEKSWQQSIEKNVKAWWKIVKARSDLKANPVNPQKVIWDLSEQLPDGAIITADSGSGTNWFARDLKIRKGMRSSLSGTLATMGCGVPYAIAAKFAHPDRPVVAIVGDGAMQMNGINELLTIAKYWKRWKDPRLVILVLHNNDLSQVTWEMRAMEGDPKFLGSQEIPNFNYAAFAELAGLKGVLIDKPEQIKESWNIAFQSDRPVVVDAHVDPNVPPLPPHIEWDQAKAMFQSILKGDPESFDIIKQSFKGKMQEFIPKK